MKQILLVDDDYLSLNAFYTLIDWSAYGLRIAFEAHSGQEALDYLQDHGGEIAIAFIDVYMPNMDGIFLLQEIRQRYPDIRCVMLSNHPDYSYVRQTLKIGAVDYLLKYEITEDSVIRLLSSHGLCFVRQEAADPGETLRKVLEGEEDAICPGCLCCGLYRDERMLMDVQQHSILQTCRHLLNPIPGAMVCSPKLGELIFLLPGDAAGDPKKKTAEAQRQIALVQRALNKYCNVTYEFMPPRFCSQSSQIRSVYHLLSEKRTVAAKTLSFLASRESCLLILAIANGQKAMITQRIHALFRSTPAPNHPELCSDLDSLLAHVRQLLSLRAESAESLNSLPPEEAFIRQFSLLCDQNSARMTAHYSAGIQEAVNYLNEHYKEDIHLNDIAQYCHLSYHHLSYQFKQETGANLINYLNRIRVFHAAHLLLFDGLPVTDAIQQVGFKGYNHFISTFKAVTGMTPTEFKKSPAAVEWMLSFTPAEGTDFSE